MFRRSLVLGMVLLSAVLPALAGEVVPGPHGLEFRDDFRFSGNHAATIAAGSATTVWWDEASWDARGDSNHVSVTPQGSEISNRFHLDVHKALSADPRDGRLSNTVYQLGGDGSPGVGVMHLDYQDILSSRLRNPMLISSVQPAVVTFHAPLFNTTGHWWELAITPSDAVVGGESTAVPGQGEAGLPGGVPGSDRQPGPGHPVAADSINLVSFGSSDVPCSTGWRVRFGVTKSVAGVRSDYVNPVASIDEYLATAPSETDTLVPWRVEFRPDGVALYADFDGHGFSLVETWAVAIPWNEVHLHLVGVAYQSDHHPQPPCHLGHIREIKWRDVRVHPVKYAATDVFPKNDGIDFVPNILNWRAYDLRDIQRFGPPVNGVSQPNAGSYTVANKGRHCNDAGFPCFGAQASVQISAPVPERSDHVLASARFVYDTKLRQNSTPGADLVINGVSVGRMPGHHTVPGSEWQAWVRRAVPVPSVLLTPGATMTADLSLDSGMYLDRLEVELGYHRAAGDLIFADRFETGTAGARTQPPPMPYVAAERGHWRLRELFGSADWRDGRWQLGGHCSVSEHAVFDPDSE